jgi:hypothetical protein
MSNAPWTARKKTVSGGLWVGDIEAAGTGCAHRRQNLALLLVAEEAGLSGMGIQPGDGNERRGQPQRQAGLLRQVNRGLDPLPRHPADGLAERHMGADVDHPQPWPDQQHAHPGRAGALRQELGMARIRKPGPLHGLFVQGRRDNGIDDPGHGEVTGPQDVVHRGAA